MKLLLTSAGITNASIHDALIDLLGKPIAESSALCIPTASYGHAPGGFDRAWWFISGQEPRCPMTELGWKSMGEPLRESCRLHVLRGWSHVKHIEEVFAGGS